MPPKVPALDSPRLRLIPLSLSDAPAIQRLFPKWEIVEFLLGGVPWPYPEDGAVAFIRDVSLPAVERGEEWSWSIRSKSEPETVVGAISLFAKQDENRGHWLAQDYQRKGLMLEACQATNRFWFETLGRPVLRELKATANIGSRVLSERQNMRLVYEVERDFVSGRLPAQVWELSANTWRVSMHRQT